VTIYMGFSGRLGRRPDRAISAPSLEKSLGQRLVIDTARCAGGTSFASSVVARAAPTATPLLLGRRRNPRSMPRSTRKCRSTVEADLRSVSSRVDVSNVLMINPKWIDVTHALAGLFIAKVKAAPANTTSPLPARHL